MEQQRGRQRPRGRRIRLLLIVLVVALLLPIPWLQVTHGFVPATAWRLNGRLEIDGRSIDPPGRWSWLAVGRPQLVAEALWDAVTGARNPPRDLRAGLITRSPALAEPAAVAVGLREAGHDIPLGLLVEVRDPIEEGYPERALIAAIDGMPLTDREVWEAWLRREVRHQPALGEDVEASERDALVFSLPDGRRFSAPGPDLPYRVVNLLEVAPLELEAGITFWWARWLPFDWLRNLSLGSSHGLMVALLSYADASGDDLAQGRHIAGTGGIRGDGTVAAIGGLPAKAGAAQAAGADVLLFPASQAGQLDGLELPGMELVPVRTLREAIEWLERPIS